MRRSADNILDFSSGRLLVAADLHGNLKDYLRVKKIFLQGKENSDIDYLLFLGDLIHGYEQPQQDRSKEIVDDIIALRNRLPDCVFSLLGNHEVCHIHNFPLMKGRKIFNPQFEKQIEGERNRYISFFKSLPIAARTKGGVLLHHSGANSYMDRFTEIFHLDHDKIIEENERLFDSLPDKVKSLLKSKVEQQYGGACEELAEKLLGPKCACSRGSGEEALLLATFFTQSNPQGQWLWDMFCNKNEHTYGKQTYSKLLAKFLASLSDEFAAMRVMVTGHIDAPEGFELFEDKQFRLCTSKGAKGDDYKYCLLLDASERFTSASQLKRHLVRLY